MIKVKVKVNVKVISGIVTAVIMAVLVAVLLAFGYDPPNPPIPEQGVEVNLGDSDFGSGLDPATQQPAGTRATQSPAHPPHTVETFHETSLPQHPGTSTTDNVKVNVNVKVEKEPEINKNALFTGRRNRQSGNGSQGVTGGSGDQGNMGGNPNSNNYSAGGANGMNYNLAGRSNVTLPRPNYTSNEQGTVVIQIWVDRDGRVSRAEYQPKGSNTSNGYLVSQAIAAARKARFNADPNAPDEQRGTITYIFKI